MKTVTPTELRANLYRLLDEVLESGLPLRILRGGKYLQVKPMEEVQKLDDLTPRPEAIQGDPDDLAEIHRDTELHLDLP